MMVSGRIRDYVIEGVIGRGGMGTVYRARHVHLETPAAIKILHEQFTDDPKIRVRFVNEARLLFELRHPNIVELREFFEDEGRLILVEEYVEGRSLGNLIGREMGPIPPEKALPLFMQVLEGIGHAHGRGIIHRDIKPGNILVSDDGRVWITDFGIAKIAGRKGVTQTGTHVGTLFYMAPELIRGGQADGRSDIYSLGITLYEMLAGRLPFSLENDTSEFEIMRAIVEEELPDPRTYYPYIPEYLVEAIEKAMSKDPQQRFSSCTDFKAALQPPRPSARKATAERERQQVAVLPAEAGPQPEPAKHAPAKQGQPKQSPPKQSQRNPVQAAPSAAASTSRPIDRSPGAKPTASRAGIPRIPRWLPWAAGAGAVVVLGVLFVPGLLDRSPEPVETAPADTVQAAVAEPYFLISDSISAEPYFTDIQDVAVLEWGTIAVLDRERKEITFYGPTGVYEDILYVDEEGLRMPLGLCALVDNGLAVSDWGRGELLLFDYSLELTGVTSGYDIAPPAAIQPCGNGVIAGATLKTEGRTSAGYTVSVWDPSITEPLIEIASFLHEFNSGSDSSRMATYMNFPDFTASRTGRIYIVTESPPNGYRIQSFTTSGSVIFDITANASPRTRTEEEIHDIMAISEEMFAVEASGWSPGISAPPCEAVGSDPQDRFWVSGVDSDGAWMSAYDEHGDCLVFFRIDQPELQNCEFRVSDTVDNFFLAFPRLSSARQVVYIMFAAGMPWQRGGPLGGV
jgi:serine/threonine protein kinase